MGVFSPAGYLKGLGWKGPGEGLNDNPHARAKPITVPQKKTLSGVGKDRDTAFPWWEMVFATVATKVGGDAVSALSRPPLPLSPFSQRLASSLLTPAQTKEHHRTSTGIISHLPPPKPSAYASGSGGINLDALGDAKMEAARRQLYSGFMRGGAIGGSMEEAVVEGKGKGKEVEKKRKRDVDTSSEEEEVVVKPSKEERRAARKQRKLDSAAASDSSLVLVSTPSTPLPDEQPSKKKKRKVPATTPYLSPEEAREAEKEAYRESREIARRAAKEERKLERVVRRALRAGREE